VGQDDPFVLTGQWRGEEYLERRSTLKGLIAESAELVPAGGLLNILPSSKNATNCVQAFYITHV
jgi:hypothetical protein